MNVYMTCICTPRSLIRKISLAWNCSPPTDYRWCSWAIGFKQPQKRQHALVLPRALQPRPELFLVRLFCRVVKSSLTGIQRTVSAFTRRIQGMVTYQDGPPHRAECRRSYHKCALRRPAESCRSRLRTALVSTAEKCSGSTAFL